MTPPRRIIPEQTVFITCRAVGRSFRFVPTEKVTQTLLFVLAYTCSKFEISIHEVVYMSNHFHVLLTAHDKCLPDFMAQLNSLASRALNALRGSRGTNIEKHYNIVVPQDDEKIIDHAVYTLANPCSADLVAKANHWTGITSVLWRYGQTLVVPRPKWGLWAPQDQTTTKRRSRKCRDARNPDKIGRSLIPESASLTLVRPPVRPDLSDDALRELIWDRLRVRESEHEADRERRGVKVLKMRNVLRQHWAAMPGAEELFGTRPTVSSRSKWARIEAIQCNREYQALHTAAKQRWLAGERDVEFPAGTWWMWRHFQVCCAHAA